MRSFPTSLLRSGAGAPALHMVLAGSNFAQGLGAFAIIGSMASLIEGLHVPLHQAGLVVSLYAVVYAISSPFLVAWAGSVERRAVLAAGLLLLTVGAAMGMLATDFHVLLVARGLMAIGGGLITPVAAAIGVATSTPQTRGRVLATVFGGLTLAQALGLPLGAWLASTMGWRATFALVTAVSAVAVVLVLRYVPRGIAAQRTSLKALGSVFRDLRLMLAVVFIVFFIGANFTFLTYLTPFLLNRYQLSGNVLAVILLLYGLGAVAGNKMGGHLTDRLGSGRTLALLCGVQVVVLPALTLLHPPIAITVVLLLVWSVFGWSVHVPQQARLAHLDPSRAPVLLALHSSAIYVGSSAGAALAGHVLQASTDQWLGPTGALQILLAAGSLAIVAMMTPRSAGQRPQAESAT